MRKLFGSSRRCSSFKAGLLGFIAGASATVTVPAYAGVNDPLQAVYLFPGARDNGGGAGTGVATSVHCTNFSGATEKLLYVVLNFDSSTKANLNLNIGQSQTRTASTHDTVLYAEDLILNTGVVNQGVVGVSSTNINIVCTAQVLDAAAATPNGFELHGIRMNPLPGTSE
jgi:hypothetical protein